MIKVISDATVSQWRFETSGFVFTVYLVYHLLCWDLSDGRVMHYEDVKRQCHFALSGHWLISELFHFLMHILGLPSVWKEWNLRDHSLTLHNLKERGLTYFSYIIFWREMKVRCNKNHYKTFQTEDNMVLFQYCLSLYILDKENVSLEIWGCEFRTLKSGLQSVFRVLILNSIFNTYWTTLVNYIIRRSTFFPFSPFLRYAIFLAL